VLIGARLVASEGFRSLLPKVVYHFLRSDGISGLVSLIFFEYNGGHGKATMQRIEKCDFELGILEGYIKTIDSDPYFPTWLHGIERINISTADVYRQSKKKSYTDYIDERFLAIEELVRNIDDILSSDYPDRIINKHARSLKPKKNESRVRFWFYSYIVFGFNKLALMPAFHNIGRWDRFTSNVTSKLGRPSLITGKHFGFPSTKDMVEKIISGYAVHAKNGMSMGNVYEAVVTNIFKCKIITNENWKYFIQPDGLPFPTLDQFKYRVEQHFTADQRGEVKLGSKGIRSKKIEERGKFSEELTNVMQKVEFDGYYTNDLPSGLIENSPLKKLCVVRAVCGLSGAIVGIGFSYAGETLAAYKMALFSMALEKSRYAKLFGCEIRPDMWAIEGIPSYMVVDKGPGATIDVAKIDAGLTARDLPPSYQPQSKATVESSHPRNITIEGPPVIVQSNLNTVEMIKRELLRAVSDNHTSDASKRMTPDMIYERIVTSPHAIYQYCKDRLRSSAYPMGFDEAVRRFLTPIEVRVESNGVYFKCRRYDSQDFRATGVYGPAARHGFKLSGYMLDLCVRCIWVDVGDRLFELDALLPIKTERAQLYVTYSELEEETRLRNLAASKMRIHKLAAESEYRKIMSENLGEGWETGKKISRQAKKTAAQSRDAEDLKRALGTKNDI
jgi:hypothetical protein